jgi:hypothetical protein
VSVGRRGAGDRRGRDRSRPSPEFGPQVGDERRRPALAAADTGRWVVVSDVVGTALLVVVGVAQVLAPSVFTLPLIVVSLAGFAVGSATFLWAFAVAVSRSRVEAIGMGGLYFLSGSAPRRVQVVVLAAWMVQIVVAFVVASLGVFTGAAFALLAPMWGIGLAGLWGARYGAFPPRVVGGVVDRRRDERASGEGAGGEGDDGREGGA